MARSIMTAFFTRYFQNGWTDTLLAWGVGLLLGSLPLAALGQAAASDFSQFKLESTTDGVYVSASLDFELSEQVEDALLKGVPVYFVAQADILQERWYWTDKKIASSERHIRLAYQALTRKWRLSTARAAFSTQGLGLALSQSFDNLADALDAVKRINRWQIASASDLDPNVQYHVSYRFHLDVSQLPRPLQIGALGQPDWNLAFAIRQILIRDASR